MAKRTKGKKPMTPTSARVLRESLREAGGFNPFRDDIGRFASGGPPNKGKGVPASWTAQMSDEDLYKAATDFDPHRKDMNAAAVVELAKRGVTPKTMADAKRANVTGLPSQEPGGNPSHDVDFKTGFKRGGEAHKKDPSVSISNAKAEYGKVSKKHGSWWVDGYAAAVDVRRGATATNGAQIASKLGLK